MRDIRPPSWRAAILLPACAAALGWGIRGQYGHETGAMVPGLLVGLVLALLFTPGSPSLVGTRAIAAFTLAIGVGGSMTYGQTVGLTHDANLVGNDAAWRWGMLGLAVKGAAWIGLGGAFLGMFWGGKRYGSAELACLLLVLLFVLCLGVAALNEPFDPATRTLPRIYFSDSWDWEPDAVDLQPRRERWGGLWAVLVGLAGYARLAKGDRLCLRLALWGGLAGGLGFPLGQCVQAFHAWNPALFRDPASWLHRFDGLNWWNVMETVFGAAWGGVLGLGVWVNRRQIAPLDDREATLSGGLEAGSLALHATTILVWNFGSCAALDSIADPGYTMILLPLLAVVAGRIWPFWMALPITLLPIAVKTGAAIAPPIHERLLAWSTLHRGAPLDLPPAEGQAFGVWALAVLLPLALAALLAGFAAQRGAHAATRGFAGLALVFVAWTAYLLNNAFFGFPRPWQPAWSGRYPNDLAFLLCAVALSYGAWRYGFRNAAAEPPASPAG